MTEEDVAKEISSSKLRLERTGLALRDVVLKSYSATKGGDPSKEKDMTGADFKELNELKLEAAFESKSSRSRVKGKQLMDNARRAALKKPESVCALAPALAAYSKVQISMSTFSLPTVDKLDEAMIDLGALSPGVGYAL
jgi:hypothetical protein